jgi:L-asparaginase II
MTKAESLVEIWRGPFLESLHRGHAVVWQDGGGIVASWGDPGQVILPRSSCKMIQALPLVESGAADAVGLSEAHLALSCASHNAAEVHNRMVTDWITGLGLDPEQALRCGPQMPRDEAVMHALIKTDDSPCRVHNNCSGKHSGFLTLSQHLGGGPDYVDPDHPVQRAVRAAFEEVTGEDSPGFGIDGCSAPNFATSLQGLARAMARFAGATGGGDSRDRAMHRLTRAMAAHPVLVAGEGRSCTALMRAMQGRVSVKTGAEAVFIAIVPERRMGVAVKIEDGGTRASEAVTAQLLVGLGVLAADHPVAEQYTRGPIRNWDGLETGYYRPVDSLRNWRV